MSESGELKCEVCQEEPAVGVACVPGVPMSVAYGRRCLEAGADPAWVLRANVACCGGVENVVPEYLDGAKVWDEGRYMSLREYLELKPLTEEELRGPEGEGEEE